MNRPGPKEKHTIENAQNEFHAKFLWYLDYGLGEESRRQAINTVANLLDRPAPSVQRWVWGQRPADWRLILSFLEREYGPPPEDLKFTGTKNEEGKG